jgi:pyruvate dehydrogenase E1 component alpha subunit
LAREPYRSEEEVEFWKGRDPITIHKGLLLEHTIATEGEMEEMEATVKAQIDEALEFARTSPYPEPEAIFEDMFANPIPIDRS